LAAHHAGEVFCAAVAPFRAAMRAAVSPHPRQEAFHETETLAIFLFKDRTHLSYKTAVAER
jgi:hypothetical protein